MYTAGKTEAFNMIPKDITGTAGACAEQLAGMISRCGHIAFFGGAGVSTESGLKDYRSSDGIYRTALSYGLPPEEILSRSCFEQNPQLFYRFFRDYFVSTAEPNSAHKALAALERCGKRVGVITQNIDGLHQKAGSTEVYELHGNASKFYCTACGREYGTECLAQGGVPHCGCGGTVKPHVTLYGELLDENVVNGAVRAIAAADLLIIGGTSLAVQPASSFVEYFRGDNIAVINRDSTPCDGRASLVFHGSIGEIFAEALKLLNMSLR